MFTLALVRFPPTATKEIQYLNVFFSSRRRHTRLQGDWSSDVCSSDLIPSLSGRGRFSPRPSGDTVSTAGGGSSTGGRGSSLLLILFCTAWLARSTTPLMPEARPSTTFCWKFGSLPCRAADAFRHAPLETLKGSKFPTKGGRWPGREGIQISNKRW